LHSRPASRPLISNDYNGTRGNAIFEDIGHSGFLTFTNMGRSAETQDVVIDSRGLNYAAVFSNIAE
jgi:hypothetical protein